VLIGGAACELIMDAVGLDFRATKDLDIVLNRGRRSIRASPSDFWQFLEEGGYQVRERSEGERVPYPAQKPAKPDFPAMLELFSRTPPGLVLEVDETFGPRQLKVDITLGMVIERLGAAYAI